MEAYKKWVREHKGYVHSMESLAKGLTWILPQRFFSSEIGPEAVNAFLGLITAINEDIIDKAPRSVPPSSVEPYSFPYPLCISALKDFETLVEVTAKYYYGDEKKWNFIALMEASKVIVRLALFRNNGYKMLINGGKTLNADENLETILPNNEIEDFSKGEGYQEPGKNNHGQNTGNLEERALSAISCFEENARSLHQREIMKHSAPVVERPTLSTILNEKGLFRALLVTGEALVITRPLIYVLFIRKYGTRSWIPWFLSLAIECFGMGILSRVKSLAAPEKKEIKRRKRLLILNLMRDPFFGKYTRKRLESTAKNLDTVPYIGFPTGKIVEILIGAQTRYTYISGA
ncbi:hypothetical protein UlMin_027469 [Ulmus minor]